MSICSPLCASSVFAQKIPAAICVRVLVHILFGNGDIYVASIFIHFSINTKTKNLEPGKVKITHKNMRHSVATLRESV